MRAISIKQPWASLIAHGIKDIENRAWKCPAKYIGQRVLIHASAAKMKSLQSILSFSQMEKTVNHFNGIVPDLGNSKGAIIGRVKIVGCSVNYPSVWAEKTPNYVTDTPSDVHKFVTGEKVIYNWILAEPILFEEPITAKGKLSFWEFDDKLLTEEIK